MTGDVTQVDLPGGVRSGLQVVREILSDVDDVHFALLSSADVVRHRLVADIVDAYARWDASGERPNLRAAAPRNGPPPDRAPPAADPRCDRRGPPGRLRTAAVTSHPAGGVRSAHKGCEVGPSGGYPPARGRPPGTQARFQAGR